MTREKVITTHINADFDALASMIAAQKLYPEATLVFPGSQEKNIRNFFLHSTSYIFNSTKMKKIDLAQVKMLILVDTRQRSRIGNFAQLVDNDNVEIHIYDHHADSKDDIRGEIEVIRKTGSTTTILADILKERGIHISPDEATIMCVGIHEDTGSFTFPSTKPEDLLATAWLIEQGANLNLVSDMLTKELTAEQRANAVDYPEDEALAGMEPGELQDEFPEENFRIVEPPVGATVSLIPEDSEEKTVGEETYYVYAGTWYKPFYSGDDVVYMVTGDPEARNDAKPEAG